MTSASSLWLKFKALLHTEWQHLTTIHPSDRRWQMPFCAALATGLPLMLGAYFGHLADGLVASLGGLVFVHMPSTPLTHRMVTLMVCAFGMSSCYALGMLSHDLPGLLVPVLSFIAIVVTMVCRVYNLGPPGSLFFIMAACIGAYAPLQAPDIPRLVGLLMLGTLLACLIAFFYSLYIVRVQTPRPAAALPEPNFDTMVLEPVVIGLLVGLSLLLAELLHLERPYWVPVSCLAVVQAATLRAVWNKQVHRIMGTGLGLLLAWGILSLPLDAWRVALFMTALGFVIESLVVRHYGLAVVFITPMTLLLAEATQLGDGQSQAMLQARMLDTVLGSLMGLLGGLALHKPTFRARFGQLLRWLCPPRLLP
jgi:uncharacterized membrane protein YccC